MSLTVEPPRLTSDPAARWAEIRSLQASDLDAVLAIERRAYDVPWPRDFFVGQVIRNDVSTLVAVCGQRVVAYLVVERVVDIWHVMNLCVVESHRRRGIATLLLDAYLSRADLVPHAGHVLEVRTSNLAARALYEKLGYVAIGVRPCYYSDNGEDAISMWRQRRESLAAYLPPSPSIVNRVRLL